MAVRRKRMPGCHPCDMRLAAGVRTCLTFGSQVGCTISAYNNDGGALVASGTTTNIGVVLTWPGRAGNYKVVVSGVGTGWDDPAPFNIALVACYVNGANIAAPLASGYHCYSPCPQPLPDTLSLSDSVIGGCTLTFMANYGFPFGGTNSGWLGTTTYDYPGNDLIGDHCYLYNNLPVTYFLAQSGELYIMWPQFCGDYACDYVCPGSDFGFNDGTGYIQISALAICSPAFMISFTPGIGGVYVTAPTITVTA